MKEGPTSIFLFQNSNYLYGFFKACDGGIVIRNYDYYVIKVNSYYIIIDSYYEITIFRYNPEGSVSGIFYSSVF